MLSILTRYKYQKVFLKYRQINLYQFAQSSRQIEKKMQQERFKNINNLFRSLDSSFGLVVPHDLTTNQVRPSSIQYTPQSLKKYSHLYPVYLAKQLKDHNNKFYKVIDDLFNSLAYAENKEAIQFIQFVLKWKLYETNQIYGEMTSRKILQMQLDLQQCFTLIKIITQIKSYNWQKVILEDIKNKIFKRIMNIQQKQFSFLFKLISFLRLKEIEYKVKQQNMQQDKDFYQIVQKLILDKINDIPLASIAEMIVHYANNIYQNQDTKLELLKKVKEPMLKNIQFFHHDELIAIFYSYIKTDSLDQQIIDAFIKRFQLLYFELSWQNKQKILQLAPSLPSIKRDYLIAISINQLLLGKRIKVKGQVTASGKQIQYQLLPIIYLSAYQSNLLNQKIVQKIQPKIIQHILSYPADKVALVAWLFTITSSNLGKTDQRRLLCIKLQSIIQGGFCQSSFTLKDIAMMVWSLCNQQGKSTKIYKQNEPFWNNIEQYIQQKLTKKQQQKLFNGICRIMWAYTYNKSLSFKTINMITQIIINLQQNNQLQEKMFPFQLTIMTTFYYSLKHSLPKSMSQYMIAISLKYFNKILQQMDYLQVMKILKYLINDENLINQQFWQKIIDKFKIQLDNIQYSSIMGVIGFIFFSPQGKKRKKNAVELVNLLLKRKISLQKLIKSESKV